MTSLAHSARLAAIILVVAVSIWDSGRRALASVVAPTNPELALSVLPSSAAARVAEFDRALVQVQRSSRPAVPIDKIGKLPKESLRQEPISARAVRQLGILAEMEGKKGQALTFMVLSHRLSRRDFLARLWLIEHEVSRNNVESTLRHYDIALRTNADNRALLFNQLVSALDEPALRTSVGRLLARRPPWAEQFVYHAVTSSPQTRYVSDMLVASGNLADTTSDDETKRQMLIRLHEQSEFDAMRRFYLALPGARREQMVSLSFGEDKTAPKAPPVTWEAFQTGRVEGVFATDPESGAVSLRAYAGPSERGLAARKILFLGPGRYRVNVRAAFESMPADGAGWLVATCVEGGNRAEFWRGNLRNPANWTAIVVPSSCPFQEFAIEAAGGGGQSGGEFSVSQVRIGKLS